MEPQIAVRPTAGAECIVPFAMSKPVSSIRNLGPAADRAFARAGITSAESLRAMGPDTAYARLLAAGTKPHFIGYYALVMGLQGRPWNDCRGAEKTALRKRFEALKSAGDKRDPDAAGRARLDAALDRIGVIASQKKNC